MSLGMSRSFETGNFHRYQTTLFLYWRHLQRDIWERNMSEYLPSNHEVAASWHHCLQHSAPDTTTKATILNKGLFYAIQNLATCQGGLSHSNLLHLNSLIAASVSQLQTSLRLTLWSTHCSRGHWNQRMCHQTSAQENGGQGAGRNACLRGARG